MRNAIFLTTLALLFSAACRPAAAGNYWQDTAAFNELRARVRAQETANPEQAVNEYQAFFQQHKDLDPSTAVEVIAVIIDLRYNALKQTELATQLADWALERYDKSPALARVIASKAMILNGEKHPEEAAALIEKEWARIMKGWRDQPAAAVLEYCRALEQMGRKEKATAALRRAIYDDPTLLSDWWQGTPPGGQLYARIIDDLLAKNQCDEALRWGKLQFVTCGWSRSHVMNEVAPVLKRIWAIRDLSDRSWKAFLAAQEDPTKPNPLADVKLPDVDMQALEARVKECPAGSEAQVNLLLAMGKPGRAMLAAREYLVANLDTAYGDNPMQAVFRATDLNFVRADQFHKWRETGQGVNPLDEFLKQHPPEKDDEPPAANP